MVERAPRGRAEARAGRSAVWGALIVVLLIAGPSASPVALSTSGLRWPSPSADLSSNGARGLAASSAAHDSGVLGRPLATRGPWTFSGANYSLGLPGDSPSPVAYDPLSRDTFVAEYPDYLAVVAPYPLNETSLVVVGSSPAAVGVVPADHEVFVANSGSDNVSVVSTLTLGVVATIPVGDFPDAIAYDNATGTVAVGNEFSLNVSLINATHLANPVSVATGLETTALAYDPGNGEFYLTGALASDGWEAVEWLNPRSAQVGGPLTGLGGGNFIGYDPAANEIVVDGGPASCACFNPRAVSLVNGSNGAAGSIPMPPTPQGLAFDLATGEMLAVVWDGSWTTAGTLYVLDPTNHTTAGSYTFPAACPQSMDFDAGDDLVLVANSCGTTLTRLELPSDTALEVAVAGGGPDAALLDPLTGDLLVANEYAANLTVWDPATQRAVGDIRVGAAPSALALDSATGVIYIANAASDNLSLVDAATDAVVGSVPVGNYPAAIAYDPHDNEIWVANYGSDNVSVVSGSTRTVIATVSGEPGAIGIAYDSGASLVFVADSFNDTLGVIRAGDLSDRWWDFVPGTPLSLTYDPAAAEIDVGEIGTSIVSGELPGVAARSAVELPAVLVRLVGEVVAVSDSTGAIEASPPAGDFPYAIALDADTSEVLTANFLDGNATVLESGTLQPVTSIPVGSAPGALAGGPTNGSVEVVNFGSDSLTALAPSRTLPEFLVNFTEAGLAAGTWNVSLDGYAWSAPVGSPIQVLAVNGTYTFAVSGPLGYVPNPPGGNVTVSGESVTVAISFTHVVHIQLYPVEFTEEGVCGLAWAVVFNGSLLQAFAGAPILINATNGTYPFVVPPLFGCRGSPANGTISVQGGGAEQSIQYSRYPAAVSSGAGWGGQIPVALLVAGGVIGAAAGLWTFLRRPRRPSPAPAVPPSDPGAPMDR